MHAAAKMEITNQELPRWQLCWYTAVRASICDHRDHLVRPYCTGQRSNESTAMKTSYKALSEISLLHRVQCHLPDRGRAKFKVKCRNKRNCYSISLRLLEAPQA